MFELVFISRTDIFVTFFHLPLSTFHFFLSFHRFYAKVLKSIFTIRSTLSSLRYNCLIRSTRMSISATSSTWKRRTSTPCFCSHSSEQFQNNKDISQDMETTANHLYHNYSFQRRHLLAQRKIIL